MADFKLPASDSLSQAIRYDYEPIGPGKNAVPWFDLLVLAFCVFAIVVVRQGVIKRRASRGVAETMSHASSHGVSPSIDTTTDESDNAAQPPRS